MRTFATQKAVEVQHRREEYLAFVAHDLRTPLSAISLSARVLEMLYAADRPDATQAALMWKTLNRNVRHLEGLVAKVIEENTSLETELGTRLERREFDLWPLVEALVHDVHPVAGTASTRLTNAVPEDFGVYADAGLLRRVFQNLIANAIAYTPRGEVVIGARQADGGAVECFVRDNGAGISADRRRTVFDKHETDPDRAGGTGAGPGHRQDVRRSPRRGGERRERGRRRFDVPVYAPRRAEVVAQRIRTELESRLMLHRLDGRCRMLTGT